MDSQQYLIVFNLLLSVTLVSSFSMKYVMDRLNAIETKFDIENQRRRSEIGDLEKNFETERKLRRSEVEELFRIISQITDSQMLTRNENDSLNENDKSIQQLTNVLPSTDTHNKTQMELELQNTESYLVRGAENEKEENVKARAKLTDIGKQLGNDYASFSSNLKNEIRNFTHDVSEKQNLLVNETRKTLALFKSEVEASILELSNTLRLVKLETVESCYNFTDSLTEQTSTNLSVIRNETIQSFSLLKSGVQKSTQELSNDLQTFMQSYNTISKNIVYADSCRNAPMASGFYYIALKTTIIRVYCDQQTDGGGWLVFQRRKDGSVDFQRTWADYKIGFGNPSGEFWLGNNNIHVLTHSGLTELRIDMEDFEWNRAYAKYSQFRIDSESGLYRLHVGGYSGNAGDSLTSRHNGMAFSTKDRDNDMYRYGSCPQHCQGAWWYESCFAANLNGYYYRGANAPYERSVVWGTWKGWEYL